MKLMICILLVITTGFFSTRKWEQVVGGWGGKGEGHSTLCPTEGCRVKKVRAVCLKQMGWG